MIVNRFIAVFNQNNKMGAETSKFEGEYLPPTPQRANDLDIGCINIVEDDISVPHLAEDSSMLDDPRSPNICRTPLNDVISRNQPITRNQNLQEIATPRRMDGGFLLNSKILNRLGCNLNDPRSPSMFINRTPIVLHKNSSQELMDVSSSESTENAALDNTFADYEGLTNNLKDTVLSVDPPKSSRIIELDPRSPSQTVERTPIIFVDDAPNEDVLIENFLVSLNMNEAIENKPLERIKNPRGRSKQRRKKSKKNIYEDEEEQIFSSPKRSVNGTPTKRTPLSCLANKQPLNMRSKSAENFEKERMTKVLLSSYDDNNIEKMDLKIEDNTTPIQELHKKRPHQSSRIPVRNC